MSIVQFNVKSNGQKFIRSSYWCCDMTRVTHRMMERKETIISIW